MKGELRGIRQCEGGVLLTIFVSTWLQAVILEPDVQKRAGKAKELQVLNEEVGKLHLGEVELEYSRHIPQEDSLDNQGAT